MSSKTTQSTTTNGTTSSTPLADQYGYLQDAWSKASGVYDASKTNQYTGSVLAGYTPEQLSNYGNMYSFAQSSGAPDYSNNVASGAAQTAANLGQTGQGQQSVANGLYGVGAGLVGSGANYTGAGANTALTSANRLNNFTPTGGVGSNIAAAGQYADNPYLSGQVDAAMRDSQRQVSEQALPQVARQSSLTGNVGSSKRGIAEGVIERGLAEKGADVSASLRGDAWKTGLGLAENGRQFDANSILQALQSGGSLGANVGNIGNNQTGVGFSGVNSGTGVGNLGLGYQNSGLNASQLGLSANNQGLTQQAGLYDIANSAGAGLQASNQNQLDAARMQAEYGSTQDWNNLAKLYSIYGSNNWGGTTTNNSTSTGTGTTTASPLTVAGSLLGAGTSLFGSSGLNLLNQKA